MARTRASEAGWVAAVLAAALGCGDGKTVETLPRLVLGAERLDFGDVPVLNRATLSLEIRNAGRAPLNLGAMALEESGTPFTLEARPERLGDGEAGAVVVSFAPERIAPFAATLAIESDDPEQPTVRVPLAGNGFTAAKMETDLALDFGRVCEGADAVKSVQVRSTGTAALRLDEIRFAEGSASELSFVSSTRTPATVAAGAELSIAVRVAPRAGSPETISGALLLGGSDPDHRSVAIPITARVNRAPVAAIAPLADAVPGATVTFDGSGSSDAERNLPLLYAWALRSSPVGSRSAPATPGAATTALTLDLPGRYAVALTVTDSAGCVSPPAFAEVLAKPAQQLLVELVWDNLDADLDLHLAPAGAEFFGPLDCYYATGHRAPDWGVPGEKGDDPRLERDALQGYGPEIIGYPTPADGRFTVLVDYFSSHRSKRPATRATVRVYQFGVVKAERTMGLQLEGQRWTALAVDWPSGAITLIDEVRP